MENEIKSSLDGVVKAIHVNEGQALENGVLMMEVENKWSFTMSKNFEEEMKRFKKQFGQGGGNTPQLPNFNKSTITLIIVGLIVFIGFGI